MATSTAPARALSTEELVDREAEAVLRWRARGLRAHLSARDAEGARLFPVLLHASFRNTPLDPEPPGVTGMKFRRSWVSWTSPFGLPPPWRTQRGDCLAEAVLSLAGPGRLEIVVVAAAGLPGGDRRRLEERCELAAEVLRRARVPLVVNLIDPEDFRTRRSATRTLLFGALLAGRLSSSTREGLSRAWRATLTPEDLSWVFEAAPTSLSSLAIGLLAGDGCPGPLPAIEAAMRRGVSSRALAGPDATPVAWACTGSSFGPDLDVVLGRLRPGATVYPRPAIDGLAPGGDREDLVAVGGRLTLAFVKAVRRSPALRATGRWREVIGAGGPRALLPLLGRNLENSVAVARGATSVQAKVRAVALIAEAGDAPALADLDPEWKGIAARLARPRSRPALLLVVGNAEGSEPPLDPINRGPHRRVALPPALAIRHGATRRPSARMLPPEEAVESLVRAAQAGFEVEVLPAGGAALKTVLRLTEVAKLLGGASASAEPSPASLPVAVEAGGRVFLADARGVRRFPLSRFLCRPRAFLPDPDAPDLVVVPGDRSAQGRTAKGIVQVRVSLSSDSGSAWLLYVDGTSRFREAVPLQELEEHIRDARSVLQDVKAGSALALRSDPDVESARRRAGTGKASLRFDVELRGQLPHRVQVRVAVPDKLRAWAGNDWYGGREFQGWEAGALAVMAHWAPGEEGRIVCRRARVTAPPGCPAGLAALYARSVAIRRLSAHIRRLLSPYRRVE